MAGIAQPVLRAVSKMPVKVRFPPREAFPPEINWGGFESAPLIDSVLCVPSDWHTFECDHQPMPEFKMKTVISGKEDMRIKGFFDTGVNFSVISTSGAETVKQFGEGLRGQTLKSVEDKLNGNENWLQHGDNFVFSLRYTSVIPEVQFGNGSVAPPVTMTFIQDLVLMPEKGLMFSAKYESPKDLFEDQEDTFSVLKTHGYFVVPEDSENNFGILFTDL